MTQNITSVPKQVRSINPAGVFLNRYGSFAFVACYAIMPLYNWVSAIAIILSILLISRKPTFLETVFLCSFLVAVIFYYLVGGDQQMPHSMDMFEGIKRIVVTCGVLSPLFLVRRRISLMAIEALCYGIIFESVYIVLYTFKNDPVLFIGRQLLLPGTEIILNSPGVVNATVLATGLLVIIMQRFVITWIALVVSLTISILLVNRTGILLSMTFILVALYMRYKDFKFSQLKRINWKFVFLVYGATIAFALNTTKMQGEIFYSNYDSIITRFESEGIESERFEMQKDGLSGLLSGEKPWGGRQVKVGDSIWYHNAFLDAYRVSGLPGFILMASVVMVSLLEVLRKRKLFLLLLWFTSFSVVMSSVVFEGLFIEFASTFIIFCIPFFLETNTVRKAFIDR